MSKVSRLLIVLLLVCCGLPLFSSRLVTAMSPYAEEFTVVLQQGRDDYGGAADTFLLAWQPWTSNDQADPLIVRSDDAATALVRFDLRSKVPYYATITSAHLQLYASSRGGLAPFALRGHRVLRPWVAGEANWFESATGKAWAEPGCDGVGQDRRGKAADKVVMDVVGEWYALDVTGLAQQWLEDPESNHGLVLKGTAMQAMEYRLYSAEHWDITRRPRLVIKYTFTGPTPTPTHTATQTATSTATATPTHTMTPTATPTPRGITSQAIQGLLALDGALNDWATMGGSPVVLNWNTAELRPALPVSPEDCSLTVHSAWDAWHLYFAFDVTDDVVLNEDETDIWNSDSVEVALDGNADHAWNSGYDHRFSIRFDGHVVHLGQGSPDITVRSRVTGIDEGYQIELIIPWEAILPGGAPYDGLRIPVNFGVHDDDNYGGYDTYFVWEGNAINDADNFGPLICGGPGGWYRDTHQQWVNGFDGATDTYISDLDKYGNYAGAGWLRVGYDGANEQEENAGLLHFDLPPLPYGGRVNRATLKLYASGIYHSNRGLELRAHQVLRPWMATEANWYMATSGVPWDEPGCNDPATDISAHPSSQCYVDELGRWYDLDVTYMVNQWLASPETNEGVVIKGWSNRPRGYEFVSSNHLEVPSHPKLEIVWRYPPPTMTATPTTTATPTSTGTSTPTPTVTSTPSPTATKTPSVGAVEGTVFNDQNGNGFQDGKEGGIEDVAIHLYDSFDDAKLDSRQTDRAGHFEFAGLAPDPYPYYVIIEVPKGYELTTRSRWDVYVTAGGRTRISFGARLRFTATPTSTSTATDTRTATSTWTPTVTPSPSRTGTPSHTPSVTATGTATSSPTISPTPEPICVVNRPILAEGFDDPVLSGWNQLAADGEIEVAGSRILLTAASQSTQFPLLWRNDLFPAADDFRLRMRFRFSRVSPYGVTIGLGSQAYDGTRYLEGEPPVPGVEDVLSIHHFDESFRIVLRGQLVWEGTPGDDGWHEVELRHDGYRYILTVDGTEQSRISGGLRPICLYVGNPTIEQYVGPWTRIEIDYCHVSTCEAWAKASLRLPLLLK